MVIKNVWGAGGVGFGGDHDILKMTFFFGGGRNLSQGILGSFFRPQIPQKHNFCAVSLWL